MSLCFSNSATLVYHITYGLAFGEPQENHREGGSFLSIVKHSACELVHEVNVLQDFNFIHMIHIFKAS